MKSDYSTYYTYQIKVVSRERVQVKKWDNRHQSLGEPAGVLRASHRERAAELLQVARDNLLDNAGESRRLGEALFELLFDEILGQDFVNFYYQVIQRERQILRIELDIDEHLFPDLAAFPWEFLCLPQQMNLGTIWLGTDPHLVLSRRRSQWIPAQPIRLKSREKLRIALAIAAPEDLPPVAYEKVETALEKLSQKSDLWELIPTVNPATPEAIDEILEREPHLFHLIGHGRFENEDNRAIGQIALVDDLNEAMWVDADYFSELFNRHRPGVVMLQACEGGMLSASEAFVGVASRLVQQNIPVVVAMQYEVSNVTASRFSRRFYERLSRGEAVDIAAQQGRRAIALSPTQYRRRDFATPAIWMRVSDGFLFGRSAPSKAEVNAPQTTGNTFQIYESKIGEQAGSNIFHFTANLDSERPRS